MTTYASDNQDTSDTSDRGADAVAAEPSAAVDSEPAGSAKPSLQEIDGIIKDHVIAAMACGLVPAPVFDMVSVVAVQLRLTHKLSKAYGVPYAENIAKSVILALVGGVLPTMATAGLASALKFMPGVGSFIGGAGVALLSGGLTYAVGRVLSQHFESGGTLLDFDPMRVRDRFKAELKAGQEAAKGMKSAAAAPAGDAAA